MQKLKLHWYKIPRIFRIGIVLLVTVFIFRDNCDEMGCDKRFVMNATTVLEKMEQLETLTTARYTLSSVIDAKIDMPELVSVLYGNQQQLAAYGEITAGVDLKLSKVFDMYGVMYLSVPHAQILSCSLNESKTMVVSETTGIFTARASVQTMNGLMRKYAIGELLEAANRLDILNDAERSAKIMLDEMFSGAGVDVRIDFYNTHPGLPDSCQQ